MKDAEIIAELVRVARLHPGCCALEALKRDRGTVRLPALTSFAAAAFQELGVCMDTAYGIMGGWDGPKSTALLRLGHETTEFDRGVAIGRAVRAQVQP